MHSSIERLCRTCADDLDVAISLESLGEFEEIQKIVNFVSKLWFLLPLPVID